MFLRIACRDRLFFYLIFFDEFFKRFYLFLERGEKEKERERNISVWLPLTCPLVGTWPATQTSALTGNRTDDSFGLQANPQSTEPHWPGLNLI